MEIGVTDDLVLSQMDVDNAFYRCKAPPGVSDWFALPRVSASQLRRVGARLCDQLGLTSTGYVTPHLEVMAMGWSWALYFCQAMVTASALRAGVPPSAFLLDKKQAPDVTGDGFGTAIYVDNAGVVGTDDDVVRGMARRLYAQLAADGLQCKELEHGLPEAQFTGMTLDRASGRISVGHRRCWKVRLAIEGILDEGFCSGELLHRIVGHFTWSAILRRCLLSIPRAIYRFIDVAGHRRLRLWPAVSKELRWMMVLLPLAYADTKRPWATVVTASDSEGANAVDNGGFGIVNRNFPLETVRGWGRQSERWRFAVDDAVQARQRALAESDNHIKSLPDPDCPPDELPPELFDIRRGDIGDFSEWGLKVRGRWRLAESITSSEGRATVIAARNRLRSARHFSHRHLFLGDNLGFVLAQGKGRASNANINRHCRQLAALSMISDSDFVTRWVPSEFNPADAASRLKTGPPVRGGGGPRDARPPWVVRDAEARVALESAVEALARSTDSQHPIGEFDDGDWALGGRSPPLGPPGYGFEDLHDGLPEFKMLLARRLPMPAKRPVTEAGIDRTSQLRAQRAKRRRREHLDEAMHARQFGQYFLEVNKVTRPSAMMYDRYFQEFKDWANTNGMTLSTSSDISRAMLEYLEELYFAGHNHDSGEKVIAALEYRVPGMRSSKTLERAKHSLRGFRRLAPGLSRAPLPWIGLCALVGAALHINELEFAQCLIFLFRTYLRPSECLGLRNKVWSFDYRKFSNLFKRVCEVAGLGKAKLHPYMMRHGGASDDALRQTRSLEAIKRRGRWAADTSVKRYEKHARVLKSLEGLPASARDYGNLIDKKLSQYMGLTARVPVPPGATAK
ncbi:unnamed protein product, partial [Prorocentrum cordatum]